jgi:Fis family transcriptional regulator, factor for inversion stimulation protein
LAPGNVGRRRVFGDNVVTKNKTRVSRKKSSKKSPAKSSKVGVKNKPLSALTGEALDGYFRKLNGHKPGDLYQLVIGEVERPLFEAVLTYTNGNQSEAAEILGINRGTLRKKLRTYNLRA